MTDPIAHEFIGHPDEVPAHPTKADIWWSLAVCGVCGKKIMLSDPITFEAPKEVLPPPFVSDGKRVMWGAVYFRDPFHAPHRAFENYCGAACAMVGHKT